MFICVFARRGERPKGAGPGKWDSAVQSQARSPTLSWRSMYAGGQGTHNDNISGTYIYNHTPSPAPLAPFQASLTTSRQQLRSFSCGLEGQNEDKDMIRGIHLSAGYSKPAPRCVPLPGTCMHAQKVALGVLPVGTGRTCPGLGAERAGAATARLMPVTCSGRGGQLPASCAFHMYLLTFNSCSSLKFSRRSYQGLSQP